MSRHCITNNLLQGKQHVITDINKLTAAQFHGLRDGVTPIPELYKKMRKDSQHIDISLPSSLLLVCAGDDSSSSGKGSGKGSGSDKTSGSGVSRKNLMHFTFPRSGNIGRGDDDEDDNKKPRNNTSMKKSYCQSSQISSDSDDDIACNNASNTLSSRQYYENDDNLISIPASASGTGSYYGHDVYSSDGDSGSGTERTNGSGQSDGSDATDNDINNIITSRENIFSHKKQGTPKRKRSTTDLNVTPSPKKRKKSGPPRSNPQCKKHGVSLICRKVKRFISKHYNRRYYVCPRQDDHTATDRPFFWRDEWERARERKSQQQQQSNHATYGISRHDTSSLPSSMSVLQRIEILEGALFGRFSKHRNRSSGLITRLAAIEENIFGSAQADAPLMKRVKNAEAALL